MMRIAPTDSSSRPTDKARPPGHRSGHGLRARSVTRHFASALCAVIASCALAGCLVSGPEPPGADGVGDPARLEIRADDHVYPGSGGNPHIIIEYGDLECSVCGRFAREFFPDIRERLIETGRVTWVFRHFPISSIHPRAIEAAVAAECAGEQRFFDYIDRLFENQTALQRADLLEHARVLGIDVDVFEACLDSDDAAARVQRDLDDAIALGAPGTPTFFVDGVMRSGITTADQFEALLE